MDPILVTASLRLRHIAPADARFILELLNEPSFVQNIGDKGVRTEDEASSYISRIFMASYTTHGYGLYLVESKEPGEPLGICGFVKREILDDADIGFAFLQRHCGRGFAYEAAAALMDHGRSALGFKRILGITSLTNRPSIRLLQKLGLRFERMIQLPGIEAERRLFSTDRAQSPFL